MNTSKVFSLIENKIRCTPTQPVKLLYIPYLFEMSQCYMNKLFLNEWFRLVKHLRGVKLLIIVLLWRIFQAWRHYKVLVKEFEI